MYPFVLIIFDSYRANDTFHIYTIFYRCCNVALTQYLYLWSQTICRWCVLNAPSAKGARSGRRRAEKSNSLFQRYAGLFIMLTSNGFDYTKKNICNLIQKQNKKINRILCILITSQSNDTMPPSNAYKYWFRTRINGGTIQQHKSIATKWNIKNTNPYTRQIFDEKDEQEEEEKKNVFLSKICIHLHSFPHKWIYWMPRHLIDWHSNKIDGTDSLTCLIRNMVIERTIEIAIHIKMYLQWTSIWYVAFALGGMPLFASQT